MNITESTLRIANEIRSEIVFDDDEIDEEEENYVTDDWVTDMDAFDNKQGLTKREYFTGLIMQGLLAKHGNYTNLVETSVRIADKLMSELEK